MMMNGDGGDDDDGGDDMGDDGHTDGSRSIEDVGQ